MRQRLAQSVLAVVMIGATTTATLAAPTGAATTQARLISVSGATTSTLAWHRSGVDVVALALARSSGSSSSSGTSIQLALPSGASVVAVGAANERTRASLPGQWHCSSGPLTTCRLDGAVAPSKFLAYVEVTNHWRTAPRASTLRIRARVDGARAVTLESSVSTQPTNIPTISLQRSATPVVAIGATGSVSYQVRDVGGAALATSAASPAIEVTKPIPTLATSWHVASASWRCQGSTPSALACSYQGPSVAVGAAAAPLTMTYRVARSVTSTRPTWVTWTAGLHVTGPFGVRLARPVPGRVEVVSGHEGTLAVRVGALGSQSVARGATRTVLVQQQASDGVASGLADTVVVPKGFSLLGEHHAGWTCPTGTGTLTCRHPGSIMTNAPVDLALSLRASANAPVGMALVAVLATALDGTVKNAGLAVLNVLGPRASSSTSPTPAPSPGSRPTTPTTAQVGVVSAVAAPSSAASSAPTRRAHVQAAVTRPLAPSSAPGPLTTCPTSMPTTLGPLSVSITSLTSGSAGCTGTVTLTMGSGLDLFSGLTLAGTVNYTDANNWYITLDATQSSITFFGATPSFAGTIYDTAGTFSGSLSIGVTGATLSSALSLSGSATLDIPSSSTIVASSAFTLTLTNGGATSPVTFPVSLSYTNASNWSVTVGANAQLAFGSISPVALAVSGTLSDASGALSGSLTATTTAPLTIVPSVTIAGTLSFAATSTSATFSGSVTLTSGALSLPVSFTYTDSTDWSAQLSVSGDSSGYTVAPNLTIPISSLSGTVTYGYFGSDFPSLEWSVTASLAPITLIANVATLSSVTLSITTCPAPTYQGQTTSSPCPTNATGTYVFLSGSLALSFPELASQTLTFSANVNLATGGFDLSASMPGPITVVAGVLSISSPSLEIAYNDPGFANPGSNLTLNGLGSAGGFSVLISATATLSFAGTTTTIPVSLVYDTAGLAVVADFSPSFALGSTGASINTVAFTTAAATMTINGLSTSVPANTFVLGGSIALPSFITTYLGLTSSPSVNVTVVYSSAANFSVTATFPESVSISASSEFSFSFGDLSLSVGVSPSQGPFVSLSESGTLSISGAAAGGTPQSVAITLALTYQSSGNQLLFSISGQGVGGAPMWSNAFGYPGLDINTMGFQAGISLSPPIPTPSFGFTASGVLPASITNDLGIGAGAPLPLSFTMNIAETSPCLAVSMGSDAPGAPTVIDIGSGVITASYATFVAAPSGCVVAGTTIAPGFAVGFNGTFLGTAITFNATLTVNPFNFSGTASVTGFSVGPFTMQNAFVSVTIGSSFSLSFSGGIAIGSNEISISGSISPTNLDLTGSATVNFGGFSLAMTVHAAKQTITFPSFWGFSPPPITEVVVNASATMSILGSTLAIQGAFTGAPGGGVEVSLIGSLDVSPGGYNLGNLNFTFQVSPQSQTLSASGSVNLGGILAGNLSGTFYHAGSTVGFNLSMAASFSLGAISGSGTFSVGNCTGSCTTTGPISATIGGSITWNGQTYSYGPTTVSPNFSFSFTSTGSVNLQSGVVDTGLVRYNAYFAGNYYLSVSSSSPYLAVSAGFRAQIQASGGTVQTHCTGNWDPTTWHCDTYVQWGGWTEIASVGVSMDTNGAFSATYGGVTYQVRV